MPVLSSRKVIELALLDPRRGMSAGAFEAARRHLGQTAINGGQAQRRLLDGLLAVPKAERPPAYNSPFNHVVAVHETAPFSASDVAWLQRLPLDPTAIGDSDVNELMRLNAQAEPRSGDARLIKSILGPVRALHDRRTAEAELARAKASAPIAPPAEVIPALVAAIRAETPELDDEEAGVRAHNLLTAAVADRDRTHERHVADVEAQLQSHEAATT